MAKKFSFRLEKVLNLRTQKVDELKEELNRILVLRYQKDREIEERELYLMRLLHAKKGLIKASEGQTHYNHINYVKEEIEVLKKEKEKIIEIENISRQKLIEAMKEEKILEKLKEKKKFIHIEEIRKEEVKVLDEVAQNRYIKNQALNQ